MKNIFLAGFLFIASSMSAMAYTIDCTFWIQCQFIEESDYHGCERITSNILTYTAPSWEDNSGLLIGNNGNTKVSIINTEERMNFIEFTGSGNTTITTVNVNTEEAIHSRNIFMGDSVASSQMIGFCSVR